MYTLALIASLALSRTPHAESRINRYDVLEFNEFASDFSGVRQVIAWDWSPTDGQHYAQWYAMLMERVDGSHLYSLSRTGDGLYRLRVNGQVVEARSVRFTKTEHDPEVHNREKHRTDQRRHIRLGMPYTFRVPVPETPAATVEPATPIVIPALPELPFWAPAKAPMIEK